MMRYELPQRTNREWTARRDGGAYVVEVVPRTEFTFGFVNLSAASYVPLVSGVSAFDWVSGLIVVRAHAASGFGGGSVSVEVRNVSMTPDDPSIVFTTSGAAPNIVTYSSAPAVGELRSTALAAPLGPMLEVGLRTSAGTATATTKLTLSIDLIGRTS